MISGSPSKRLREKGHISAFPSSKSVSQKQVRDIVALVLNGTPISSIEQMYLPALIRGLRKYFTECIENKNPYQAEITELAMHEAQTRLSILNKENSHDLLVESIKKRLISAYDAYNERKVRIDEDRKQLVEDFEIQISTLSKKHEKEYKNLRDACKSPQKMRQFNRASNNLKNLRNQAKLYLNSHRYDDMRIVEKKASDLEEFEVAKNVKAYEESCFKAEENLLVAHNEKMNVLRESHKAKLDSFEKAAAESLFEASKRIEKLNKELEHAHSVYNKYTKPVVSKATELKTERGLIPTNPTDMLSLPPLLKKWPNTSRK